MLDIRSTGTKSFYVYKKIKGQPERVFLGCFPDMTVENVRKKALVCLAAIANGINPQDEARAVRSEYTFEKLFNEYMERYAKKYKRSWKYDEGEVNKFLTHWFSRSPSSIHKGEVQLLREKIHDKHGMYQAIYEQILFDAKKSGITLPTGLMDIHIHDIRRAFGSYQAITGAGLQIIGKSLGHKSPQSTQVYARLNLDPVRASIEKATQVMFGQ